MNATRSSAAEPADLFGTPVFVSTAEDSIVARLECTKLGDPLAADDESGTQLARAIDADRLAGN